MTVNEETKSSGTSLCLTYLLMCGAVFRCLRWVDWFYDNMGLTRQGNSAPPGTHASNHDQISKHYLLHTYPNYRTEKSSVKGLYDQFATLFPDFHLPIIQSAGVHLAQWDAHGLVSRSTRNCSKAGRSVQAVAQRSVFAAGSSRVKPSSSTRTPRFSITKRSSEKVR